jgi:hypothetical protein
MRRVDSASIAGGWRPAASAAEGGATIVSPGGEVIDQQLCPPIHRSDDPPRRGGTLTYVRRRIAVKVPSADDVRAHAVASKPQYAQTPGRRPEMPAGRDRPSRTSSPAHLPFRPAAISMLAGTVIAEAFAEAHDAHA